MTGANSGLDRAMAKSFGKHAAKLVVNYRSDPDSANGVVEESRRVPVKLWRGRRMSRGREKSRRCSRRPRSERYGTLDIVVANAGLQRDAPVDEMTVFRLA